MPQGSHQDHSFASDDLFERASSVANSPVRSVVVDFDGTIVRQDVSEEILRAFAPAEWWDIDLEFQRGKIGSRECLMRQAALLGGKEEAMMAFATGRFGVDPTFSPFVGWARGLGMEVAVASDGLGFYIEPMLRAAGILGLPVFTNRVLLGDGARSSLSRRPTVCALDAVPAR